VIPLVVLVAAAVEVDAWRVVLEAEAERAVLEVMEARWAAVEVEETEYVEELAVEVA
jgi:hypothetical protein